MNFDDFNKIKPVDVSPFLFEKIKYRIKQMQSTELPARYVWAFGGTLALIVSLNFFAITALNNKEDNVTKLATAIHLSIHNNLY